MSNGRFIVHLTAFLTASIVASCTTTEQANDALEQRFLGTRADNFFKTYGPPAQFFKASDGQTVYVWAENAKEYYISPTAHTTVTQVGTTAFATTNFVGGGVVEVQCQVKLLADQHGRIIQIEAHKDTWGDWETSRCHEVFAPKT